MGPRGRNVFIPREWLACVRAAPGARRVDDMRCTASYYVVVGCGRKWHQMRCQHSKHSHFDVMLPPCHAPGQNQSRFERRLALLALQTKKCDAVCHG